MLIVPRCSHLQASLWLRRALFTFPSTSPNVFKEEKILPYTQQQLYQVVSDVSSYPKFIPHCVGSRVLASSTLPQTSGSSPVVKMEAELTVGFMAFKESYVSKVTCTPHETVEAVATSSSPLFKTLTTTWRFKSASPAKGSTLVTLELAYQFANPLHAAFSDRFFGKVSKTMVSAFEERCRLVYGKQPSN